MRVGDEVAPLPGQRDTLRLGETNKSACHDAIPASAPGHFDLKGAGLDPQSSEALQLVLGLGPKLERAEMDHVVARPGRGSGLDLESTLLTGVARGGTGRVAARQLRRRESARLSLHGREGVRRARLDRSGLVDPRSQADAAGSQEEDVEDRHRRQEGPDRRQHRPDPPAAVVGARGPFPGRKERHGARGRLLGDDRVPNHLRLRCVERRLGLWSGRRAVGEKVLRGTDLGGKFFGRMALGRTHLDREDLGRTLLDWKSFGRMLLDRENFGRMLLDRKNLGRMLFDQEDLGRTLLDRRNRGRPLDDRPHGAWIVDRRGAHRRLLRRFRFRPFRLSHRDRLGDPGIHPPRTDRHQA